MESEKLKIHNELRPYEEYKETDLLWIDHIPKHWNMIRNKNVMKVQKEIVGENHSKYTLLSLTKRGIIPRDLENAKGKFPKDFEAYQVVNPNNIVLCLFDMDETPRTVGLSSMKGMITGSYNVFKIENINEKYLYYYYLSLDNSKKLRALYTGLRKVIHIDTFLRTKMPNPPMKEQIKIVKYLDYKLSKISKFIKAKKKIIDLLKQEKKVFINEIIIGKLKIENGECKVRYKSEMKQSHIQWVKEIPKHWIKCKLKHLGSFKSGDCITSSQIDIEGKYPVYGGNGLRGYFNKYTHDGDYLLIGRQGALCGNVHLVKGRLWASEHAVVVTTNSNVDVNWAKYLIETMNLNQYSQSAAQPGLAIERIINIYTILPPIEEQKKIVEYIKRVIDKIDKSILHINKEISLITEYGIRLISDVVTGKVDVRNISIDEANYEIEDEAINNERK
ncbi:restriction endonuclease subunit S [Clostridium sporogenes]|uniref:Restriction endonuclease subunit S n=1 Tax=Clostridium sporogenes TaxID=1509 RepID=A0AAE4FHM2_CLOSG|nr:restriction endonuclease subunit S [Clostridium sporogenes]MDS1002638.1 restriction endonuclease subunit S [Clostridium sporogenes]